MCTCFFELNLFKEGKRSLFLACSTVFQVLGEIIQCFLIFWRKYFTLNSYYSFLSFQSDFLISILPNGCNFNIKINSNITGKNETILVRHTNLIKKTKPCSLPVVQQTADLIECSQRLESFHKQNSKLPFTVGYQDQALT